MHVSSPICIPRAHWSPALPPWHAGSPDDHPHGGTWVCRATGATLSQLGTDMQRCLWETAGYIQDWRDPKKVNDRFRHHCRITLLQLVLPSTSTPWAMASSGTLGEGCQILGEGGWAADGRRSLWAYFSTPGPAGQDWLHHSESGISRCYWCGTGIIHSACCRCREIPQMASFFKTPLPKSFKTKLAISVCIGAPFLLLIFALYHYWCEEQAAAAVTPARGWKEIIFRNPVNGGGSLFCLGFDFCFALLLLLYLTSK